MGQLTNRRVNFGTNNTGDPDTSSLFSGFPFPALLVTDSEWNSTYKLSYYHGPFTIQKVAEIYWRGKTINVEIEGVANLLDYDPTGSATPISAVVNTSGFDIERPSVEFEKDLITHQPWIDIAGGAFDSANNSFVCSATGSPVDQGYFVSASAQMQITMFSNSGGFHPLLLRENGDYYIQMHVQGFLGGHYQTGGDCANDNVDIFKTIDGPVDTGEAFTATVFGQSMKMTGSLGPIFLPGSPTIAIDGFDAFTINFSEYWPYANSDGLPIYDTDTGSQLRSPLS